VFDPLEAPGITQLIGQEVGEGGVHEAIPVNFEELGHAEQRAEVRTLAALPL
jgi:hypothetical protein